MSDISYITVSRNDDYDPDNIKKLALTINENVKQLIDRGLNVETLLVDWCSDDPFYLNDEICKIDVLVNHLVIDKSIPKKDGINPNYFLEYFAKNIGIRHSTGKYTLVENSDILNDEELSDSIVKMVKENINGVYGRPTLRINACWPNCDEYTHYDKINEYNLGDCTPGDFIIATKNDFQKIGAYNEVSLVHKHEEHQIHMDVEILYQFNLNSMPVYYLQGYYRHLQHPHDKSYHKNTPASERNCGGYINRPTWGYSNAIIEQIKPNVIKLTLSDTIGTLTDYDD